MHAVLVSTGSPSMGHGVTQQAAHLFILGSDQHAGHPDKLQHGPWDTLHTLSSQLSALSSQQVLYLLLWHTAFKTRVLLNRQRDRDVCTRRRMKKPGKASL